ncbi:tyrosine-type recombinase/integrase [Rhizobium sp. SL86]|uniref:tyrosine-type recombinase/integrase n=1 Tax=Rhizobium sp. SL86 TaxID=2995148 RepID=UPI002272BC68|nr:tyrosine-type recombinase/integrase [Rhizobium sp. SL86]MCY1664585.1 tyrosine-type recombinase/integrase [Rhizobium sp. SL86]
MRVKLKGLNKVRKTLANGETVTYWYAWKGGPRLPGRPGDHEFMAAYNEAVARKVQPQAGTLQTILNGFQDSADWDDLAPRTQKDYIKLIKVVEAKFGTFPLSALGDRRARAIFMAWRDERAKASRRQADYGWQVLARILSWAHGRGLVVANPCEKGGRLYRGSRAEIVWTDADEAAFLALAPLHLHLALILALWTGQRQGDLLMLTWPQYDGETIRLVQGKTRTRVVIPVGAPLKAALDAARQKIGKVLLNSDGEEWTPDGFRTSWRKACAKAGVVGVTFNDLRGTAVTRLAIAGCTEAEIATITGHSLRDVRSILDAHYLNRDPQLAQNAIRKLEARTKSPN